MALTEIMDNLTNTEGHTNLVAFQFCAKHLAPMLADLAKEQKGKSQALSLIKPDGKLRKLRNVDNERTEQENKSETNERKGTSADTGGGTTEITYRAALLRGTTEVERISRGGGGTP